VIGGKRTEFVICVKPVAPLSEQRQLGTLLLVVDEMLTTHIFHFPADGAI
jgi:hypothetical protein